MKENEERVVEIEKEKEALLNNYNQLQAQQAKDQQELKRLRELYTQSLQ
jgi:hypothetical protein